jgi:hypothetical protein
MPHRHSLRIALLKRLRQQLDQHDEDHRARRETERQRLQRHEVLDENKRRDRYERLTQRGQHRPACRKRSALPSRDEHHCSRNAAQRNATHRRGLLSETNQRRAGQGTAGRPAARATARPSGMLCRPMATVTSSPCSKPETPEKLMPTPELQHSTSTAQAQHKHSTSTEELSHYPRCTQAYH